VEAYRAAHPALAGDDEALLDLICHEVRLRREQGEAPDVAEYQQRFPELHDQLKRMFELQGLIESSLGDAPGPDGAAARPAALPPLPAVPGYEVLRLLGRGGQGAVYLARDIRLHRLVALKMIRDPDFATAEERARLEKEAKALAQFHHPNIVQVYEVGEHQGLPYLALEHVSDGSLDRLLQGAPQPAEVTAALIETLARAIHEAHQRGFVHRDLKPANVLLRARGETEGAAGPLRSEGLPARPPLRSFDPKITDFGLAKRLSPADGGEGPPLTASNHIVGTPSYMAPEQAGGRNRDVGPPADVYALGAILYELLTGRPPFKAETPTETALLVIKEEPVPPSRLRPRLPRDLETICLKCLEKEPAGRYPSAEALADDLRRFLAHEPIQAWPVGAWGRAVKWARRRPARAGLVVAALSLVVLAGVLWYAVVASATVRALDKDVERLEAEKQRQEAANRELERQAKGLLRDVAAKRGELADKSAEVDRLTRQGQAVEKRANTLHYSSNLLKASVLRARGDVAHVLEVLKSHLPKQGQEDLRDFEWYYLWRDCGRESRTLSGAPNNAVVDMAALGTPADRLVAFRPDGQFVASTGADKKTVIVWNATTGEEALTLTGHKDTVYGVAFSPDGTRLASADKKGTVRVWDVSPKQGKDLRDRLRLTLQGHQGRACCVAVSPDGKYIASADLDQKARVWQVTVWQVTPKQGPNDLPQPSLTLKHRGRVWSVALGPNGLLAFGVDKTVKVWNVAAGKAAGELEEGHKAEVTSVAFGRDGRWLVSGDADGKVKVWDVVARKQVVDLDRHAARVTSVALSRDGTRLASAAQDQTVLVWELALGKSGKVHKRPYLALRAGAVSALSVALSPDGRRLATAGPGGVVKIWDATASSRASATPRMARAFAAWPSARTAATSPRSPAIGP
jgi:WD40 repeat protein